MTHCYFDTDTGILKDIDINEGILDIENDGQLAEAMELANDFDWMLTYMQDSLCIASVVAEGVLRYVKDKDEGTARKMRLAIKKCAALIDILRQDDSWWELTAPAVRR
jgi:hypothetical protein